ncbi:MAG: 2-oxoacid:acceptor oxidoreductase family protein, partial [Actinomycetes bacterium]
SVLRHEDEYPDDLSAAAAARGVRLLAVDAEGLAREAGTLRAVNVALLGAASTALPFTQESWRRGLAAAVPAKILEVNERAFALGRESVGEEDEQ